MNDTESSGKPDEDLQSDDGDEIIDLRDVVLREPDDPHGRSQLPGAAEPADDDSGAIPDSTGGAEALSDAADSLLDHSDPAMPGGDANDAMLGFGETDSGEEGTMLGATEGMDVDDIIDSVIENALELEDAIAEELNAGPEPVGEFAGDLGMDLDEDDLELMEVAPVAGEEGSARAAQDIDIPAEKIEEALEQVVTKVYSDTIKDMLVSVVEKTVKDEIEKLRTLIDNATDDP